MLQAALYKGRMAGPAGAFNIATCTWLRGPYSHCEWSFSDGLCGSASLVDRGVRLKRITLTPDKWDVWPVCFEEAPVREWFEEHEGDPYDLLGVAGHVARVLGHSKRSRFCAEAMAESIGLADPWRFDPCSLAAVLWAFRTDDLPHPPSLLTYPNH